MVNCKQCGDDLGGCPSCKPLPGMRTDYAVADAGRALVRCFWQDYAGTMGQLARLRAAQRKELATAYVAYYTQHGGTARMTVEEVMRAWERSAPARDEDGVKEGTEHSTHLLG